MGYLTIGVFEPLGQVYPVFGIHTAVFKLVWPLGLVFKLLELVYVVVLNIELKHELEFGLRGLPHLVSKCPGFSHVAVISVLRLWTDFCGFFTILFNLIFTFYRTEIERLRCTATSSRDFTKCID